MAHHKVIMDLKLSLENAHAEIEYLHRLCGHVPDSVANSMTSPVPPLMRRSQALASPIPFNIHHQRHQHHPHQGVSVPHVPPQPKRHAVIDQPLRNHDVNKYSLNSRGSSINSTSYHLKHSDGQSTTTGSNSSLSKKSNCKNNNQKNRPVIHESDSQHLVSRGTSL